MRRYIIFFTITALCRLLCGCYQESDRNLIGKLIAESSFEFSEGRLFRMWSDDSLVYISHGPNFGVSAYTRDGQHVKDYGEEGQAPWQNGSIWGFFPDLSKQQYWVFDYTKQSLKLYSEKTDSLLFLKKILTQNNVFRMKDAVFMIIASDYEKNDIQLQVTDFNNDSVLHVLSMKEMLVTPERKSDKGLFYTLNGNFASSIENDKILYYSHYTGRALLIDTNTYNWAKIEDFRKLPFPVSTNENGKVVVKPHKYVFVSAAMDEKYLYFLSPGDLDKKFINNTFYIDQYTLDGEYQGSYAVPKGPMDDIPIIIEKNGSLFTVAYTNGFIATYKYDAI